jgi:hypothetical protein
MIKNKVTNNINTVNSTINKKVKSLLPLQLQYIFGVYFLGLLFFLFYRLIIFVIECFTDFADIELGLLFKSLLMGLRFDTVVSCYVLSVFLFLMAIAAVFNIRTRYFYRPLHYILILAYAVCFLICCIDIPYFNYFSNRLNIVSLSGISFSFIIKLIVDNPIFIIYGVVYLLSLAAYLWLMYCIYNATLFKTIPPYSAKQNIFKTISVSIVMFALCFVGSKTPSNNRFFNQIGLNPIFTLVKSYQESKQIENKPIALINDVSAKMTVDQEFVNRDDDNSYSPTLPNNSNIVLVIMDSLPNNALLLHNSLYFDSIYADDNVNFTNVYCPLFGFPSIFTHTPMRSTLIPTIKGLPNILSNDNYTTYFYSYADNQTKNIASFLHYNSIDKIMEMKTNKSILTNSIKSINQQYSQEKPFFACIYASSLYSNNSNKEIDSFIRQAKRSSWFKNTLFVFIGNQTNEKPLIFYYPKVIKPQINHTIGMQIDVVPTILSMLDKNYHNETMGMNLFAGKRSYAYYSNNQQICVLDSVFMYVYNKDKSEELYLYKSENNRTNVVKFYPDKVKEMQTYGFSMLQNSQYRLSQIQLQKH